MWKRIAADLGADSRMLTLMGAAVASAALAAACSESSVEPLGLAEQPLADIRPAQVRSCPANPDYIVDDVESLHDAHTGAPPGSVIAIEGMIVISADINADTDGHVFTCATPGSGIAAEPGVGVNWLFIVRGRGVKIENLVLDASEALDGAVLALACFGPVGDVCGSPDERAEEVEIAHNDLSCSSNSCVFLAGAGYGETGGRVHDNHFVTPGGTAAAIQVGGFRNVTVERNTIHADGPAGWGIMGNADVGLLIRDNHVMGPWDRSLHLLDGVYESEVVGNHFVGAMFWGVGAAFADGLRFENNIVGCGEIGCMIAAASPGAIVAANRFTSAGSSTGVHLQQGTDGMRIERNVVIATEPSTGEDFGGIRIRDGADVVVRKNQVIGPWANGISLRLTDRDRIAENEIRDAVGAGIRGTEVRDDIFATNKVTGSGLAGIFLSDACGNRLVGNNLNGNADGLGMWFDESTGANVFVGQGSVVVNNGDYDCDGDGVVDPNLISGAGSILTGHAAGTHGAALGPASSQAAHKGLQ
ncbi:MAG: right-handed parallel beta-helix repeat-containing protein [Gemmatimonadota bacterium]|nr:MAG: right-handed parallel beta-helix repeat-containing protein [Gemmatimonadota bacterium]